MERLRPDNGPADTGGIATDLHAWAEQYFEEMTSGPGKAMIRDVIASTAGDGALAPCSSYTREQIRSEEHTSELQSLMRISYAVFCLKKKTNNILKNKEKS